MRGIIFSMIIGFGLNIFAADDQSSLWDPKEYDETSRPQFELVVGYLNDKKNKLANCKVIVDLGCCVGKTTNYFAEEYPGATVVGVDPEERAISHATKTYKKQSPQ